MKLKQKISIFIISISLFIIISPTSHSEIVLNDYSSISANFYFKADPMGIYIRESEGEPIRLYTWSEIDLKNLEENKPNIYSLYDKLKDKDSSLSSNTIFLDKDGNISDDKNNNTQIETLNEKNPLRKFTLKGINGTIIMVDGILKANKDILEVEPDSEWGTVDVYWAYIDKDYLKKNNKKLYDVYTKSQIGEEIILKWGSSAIKKDEDTNRKYTFKKSTGFEELTKCRYIPHNANDGDSFHVRCKGEQYVFRLYFVDTTETSNSFPKRVNDQSRYFGIDLKRTLDIGHQATDFTRRLIGNKPFTVYTKWQDAMGGENVKRNYAFILCSNGKLLSELLTEKGLVRVFGQPTTTPNGINESKWRSHLKKLEDKAKRRKLGGWKK